MVTEAMQPGTFTKRQAFALCKDLLHGFSSAEFQMQMKGLLGGKKAVRGHLPGRSELAFTVQSKVLSRHGLPSTEAGMHMMYDIIYPLLDDPTMHPVAVFIEDNLGMNAETSMGMLMSLFRSDPTPDWKRLTKHDAQLIRQEVVQEVVEGLSHPEVQTSLHKLSADDVQGRLKLALSVQSAVISAHGIQGVDNLFSFFDFIADEEDSLLEAFTKILGMEEETLVQEVVTLSRSLTMDEVVSITKELMEGFCTLDFLQSLQKLGANDPAGRKKLAFTVHQRVLPKYGIPGTPGGVQYLLQVIAPYLDDMMLILENHGLQHMLQEIENSLKADAQDIDGTLPCLLNSKPNTVVDAKPRLTKDEAFQMVWQLLEGYSSPDFQSQLLNLARNKSSAKSNLHSLRPTRQSPKHVPGRSKLALTVQTQVFPRFGLPGTFDGEKAMREAISPFMDDWMLREMLWATEAQLGKNNETVLEWLLSLMRKDSQSPFQANLTKIQILSISKELAEGFSSFEFQMKLQDYLSVGVIAHDMPGRMELALEVYSKVLPTYGIPGSYAGVALMLEAMLPYTAEEEIEQLHASFLGAISPFMHDWIMLMDVVALEDMIQLINDKLDEIKAVDEAEDIFVDNFACLDHGELDSPGSAKKMSDHWGRQVSGYSEASTACPFGDSGDVFSRQVSGNSELSELCPLDASDFFSRQLSGKSEALAAHHVNTVQSDASTASPRDLELEELMQTLDVY